jgi:hypothetical protein
MNTKITELTTEILIHCSVIVLNTENTEYSIRIPKFNLQIIPSVSRMTGLDSDSECTPVQRSYHRFDGIQPIRFEYRSESADSNTESTDSNTESTDSNTESTDQYLILTRAGTSRKLDF